MAIKAQPRNHPAVANNKTTWWPALTLTLQASSLEESERRKIQPWLSVGTCSLKIGPEAVVMVMCRTFQYGYGPAVKPTVVYSDSHGQSVMEREELRLLGLDMMMDQTQTAPRSQVRLEAHMRPKPPYARCSRWVPSLSPCLLSYLWIVPKTVCANAWVADQTLASILAA